MGRSLSGNERSERWRLRWTVASAAWFATCAALVIGEIGWRTAVMAAATAFMLVRAGDMLDE